MRKSLRQVLKPDAVLVEGNESCAAASAGNQPAITIRTYNEIRDMRQSTHISSRAKLLLTFRALCILAAADFRAFVFAVRSAVGFPALC